MKYIIYCHAYNKASGGNAVTYELCKKINQYFKKNKCFIAPTFCRGDAISSSESSMKDIHGRSIVDIENLPESYFDESKYNLQECPLITKKMLLKRNNVAIYTEGMLGNPLEQKHIIRWICYFTTPGLPVDKFFPWSLNDKFCFWSYPYFHNKDKYFIKLGENILKETYYYPEEKDCLFLKLPLLHHDFKDFGYERSGECHMIRKADPNYMRCAGKIWDIPENSLQHKEEYTFKPKKPNFIHSSDSELIDFISPEETINIFNRKEIFYCYDLYTFHSSMAAMCGCKVVVVPYENFSEDEWSYKEPILKVGLAYGMERLEHAVSTSHLVKETIQKAIDEISSNIERFLNSPVLKTKCSKNIIEKIFSKTQIDPPEIKILEYQKDYTIDFWSIKFNFICNKVRNSVIADFNSNENGGPKIIINENKLKISVGNSFYTLYSNYESSELEENKKYKLKIKRKGYHIFITLQDEDKILLNIGEVNIFFPLKFNNIELCKDFEGTIENFYMSYF